MGQTICRVPKGGPPPRPCTGKTISARKGAAGRPVAGYEAAADMGRRQGSPAGPEAEPAARSRGSPAQARPARPWRVRLRPEARSPTARRRGRDRRRRISDWRRRRAGGSPLQAPRFPASSPILSSSSTSSAPLPRCTERLRRSAGSSSTPCSAISASMLPAAFGADADRVSSGPVVVSGSEKPVELVRRVLPHGRSKRGAVRSVDAHRHDLARR